MIAFIGLSNKPNKEPLDSSTKSGALIDEIISAAKIDAYKTNLCKFAPLTDEGKLRYPSASEMNDSVSELMKELDAINVDKVFLLGQRVKDTVSKWAGYELESYTINKINCIEFIPIYHPSYISSYKGMDREKYINNVVSLINRV